MTSSMSRYPMPQIGGTVSAAGDEFFESQGVGWPLWGFSASDDHQYTAAVKQEPCSSSTAGHTSEEEERSEGPAPFEDPRFTQLTEDIFLSQFSDEEMRRMDDDAPFQALDMFPDYMHRLLSYENMLTGVLTGSNSDEEGGRLLDRDGGVDTKDTCGFPLFIHDQQSGSRKAEQSDPETLAGPSSAEPDEEDKQDGLSRTKRSRPVTGTEDTPGFEALVLEELEGVVFQLAKRTRICYRDAFYRLAESSRANCSAANVATEVGSSASRQSFHQQPGGSGSRFSTPGSCPERETNPIDRTVMVLTMKPPRQLTQLHGTCYADGTARSATSWTTRAGVGGSKN